MNYVSAREGIPVPTKPYARAGRAEWVVCERGTHKLKPGAFHVCVDLSEPAPVVAPKPKKAAQKRRKSRATPKPRVARQANTCACGTTISKEAVSCRPCEGKRRKKAGIVPVPFVGPIQARMEEVIRRYEAGEPTQKIADDLGVTPSGLRLALRRRGVTMRKRGEGRRGTAGHRALTVEQETEAARLYKSGLSLDAVGVHFGISQHAVINALRRLGVPTRPRGGSRSAA